MSQPTKAYVKRSTCPSDIVEKYDTQAKTLNLAEWKTSDSHNTLEGHPSSGPDGMAIPRERYATTFSMDIWQKQCRHLVHTFSSPILLRRYSLVAAISLSGATTQKFRLELPVQIRAYSNSDDSTVTNNREEDHNSNILSGLLLKAWPSSF
ncbi:hypothetical protein V496_06347 [Pseudogymnoascus sp. VKM F-4515 (FW-2607)]|nr:hypothetical protein V496_06347 [Pseudogymnoascus sp. VKM F-4515 (FW-2607)]